MKEKNSNSGLVLKLKSGLFFFSPFRNFKTKVFHITSDISLFLTFFIYYSYCFGSLLV